MMTPDDIRTALGGAPTEAQIDEACRRLLVEGAFGRVAHRPPAPPAWATPPPPEPKHPQQPPDPVGEELAALYQREARLHAELVAVQAAIRRLGGHPIDLLEEKAS